MAWKFCRGHLSPFIPSLRGSTWKTCTTSRKTLLLEKMLLSATESPSQPVNDAEVSCPEGRPGQSNSLVGKQWAPARNLKYVRSYSWRRSHRHGSKGRCNSVLVREKKNTHKPQNLFCIVQCVSLSMCVYKAILIATESEDPQKLFLFCFWNFQQPALWLSIPVGREG